jgi:hypothetical protein
MFTLDKWYLDLVTDDGTAFIGYAADLRWHALHFRYAALLDCRSGGTPREHATVRHVAPPDLADGRLTWTCAPLHLAGEWTRLAAPVEEVLLDVPDGRVEWRCLLPRASASLVVGDRRYEGPGYAERLTLTIAPWDLPFRALRWGRHLSAGHALVWIEWDGDMTRRWAWLDGEPQPLARVEGAGITGLADGRALRWEPGRDLRRRSVLDALREVAPALVRGVTGRLGAMDEHKQLSRSSLMADGRMLDSGWAIHEEVTW